MSSAHELAGDDDRSSTPKRPLGLGVRCGHSCGEGGSRVNGSVRAAPASRAFCRSTPRAPARGTAAALPAVLLRPRVPGAAGNRRERPSTNPSLSAAFRSSPRDSERSEPVTENRGERFGLAYPSPFRSLCGPFAVPIPSVCHRVRVYVVRACRVFVTYRGRSLYRRRGYGLPAVPKSGLEPSFTLCECSGNGFSARAARSCWRSSPPAGVSGAVLLLPVQVSVLGVPGPAVTPTNLGPSMNV